MTVAIVTNGIDGFEQFFRELPDIAEKSMMLALNQVAGRDGLAVLKSDMREQIDFPSGYLETSSSGAPRLSLARKAGRDSLEAVIRGRDRATSLARFAPAQTYANTRRTKGLPAHRLQVRVKPGAKRVLNGAFLMKLKNGNTGLAVRLKPGQSLRHSQAAVSLGNNLFLLYGPSVEQVFSGVADDRAADIANMVSKQFLRQFLRFTNG